MSTLYTDIDCKHCDAKKTVFIDNMWANACTKCGGEHNGFGQPLAPREQWGYDTGEEGEF
jgi:hypothetical protein